LLGFSVFLAFLDPSKAAAEGGRTSRVHRTRAARGIAPISTTGQDGLPAKPVRPERTLAAGEGAAPRVPFSLVTFLLASKSR
jgi:hypothetical protein